MISVYNCHTVKLINPPFEMTCLCHMRELLTHPYDLVIMHSHNLSTKIMNRNFSVAKLVLLAPGNELFLCYFFLQDAVLPLAALVYSAVPPYHSGR